MSELINNLNTIYNVKLQIKEAIGTESDDFSQYPSYISNLLPSGTSYITNNGDYNISSYEYVNVNVSGGGSTGTVIDEASDLFDGGVWDEGEYIGPSNGADVDVRGLTKNSWGAAITPEIVEYFAQRFPATEELLTYNIGSYILTSSIPGGDGQPYFIYPTQASPDNAIYSVKGKWGNYGNPGTESAYFFIVSDVTGMDLIPRGGSGELNITENETFDVSTYTSVNVSVPGSAVSGTSYITANGDYDISSYEFVNVNVSGGGSSTNTFSGYCFPYFDSINNIYVWHILDDISGESGSEEFNTSNIIVATSSAYISGTSEHDLTSIVWGQYVTITADKYYGFSHISTVDNNYATIDTTVYPDNITNYYPLQTQTGDSVGSIANNNFAGEVKLFGATLEGETLNCANKIKVGTGSVYKMYSIDSSSSIAKNDVVTATYVPVKIPGTGTMYPGNTIEVVS